MRILIWGLGYVGTVSAACLAKMGHDVTGVEPNTTKVEAINAGRTPVNEPGLQEIVAETVATGRLRATTEGSGLVPSHDVSLICVGTPSAADGSPVLSYVENVAEEIGRGLADSERYHVVTLRSTVFPGTTRRVLLPPIERFSGRNAGEHFGIVMNPEFLREASAVDDFATPPYTVIGELDAKSGDVLASLYEELNAPIHRVEIEEAEILKLTNNAFHALKIGFANEIGRLCDAFGIDSHAVMDLVCADEKLNISPAYLRPGFAFGGSCLPKDLRSISHHAQREGVSLPILDNVLVSNREQIEAARRKVHDVGAKRVGVLGLSFKAGTDDLRESPVIALIQSLWRDGVDVRVYDPDVDPDRMLGSNRDYLERQLPQIDRILSDSLDDVLAGPEAIVVTQNRDEFLQAIRASTSDAVVIDLVRLTPARVPEQVEHYNGISW
ncbi:MAG: nucleotide sugar dehydrogenase [Rhodothermales bacterium]